MPRSSSHDDDAAAAGGTRSSASMIAAFMDTGSHELTVSGYPGMTGFGVGNFFSSAAFTVGEHRWIIRLYPDGFNEKSADYISVFLELDNTESGDDGAELIADFTFDLLDQVGEPVQAYTMSFRHDFFGCGSVWGYDQFIRRKELEESDLIESGSFRITCYIIVIDVRTESTPARFSAVRSPPTELQRDLGGLLETKLGSDVQFIVDKETFAAHRNVLGIRSPVFKAELFGSMKENNEAAIWIHDMEPRVFAAMLHFMYTDSLPEIDEDDRRVMAQHLLVAGDRYRLEGLKTICENMLCKCINTDTVATTLVLADQHGCQRLKEGCINFLKYAGNVKAVMDSDGFDHLMSSCPSLLKELLVKLSP